MLINYHLHFIQAFSHTTEHIFTNYLPENNNQYAKRERGLSGAVHIKQFHQPYSVTLHFERTSVLSKRKEDTAALCRRMEFKNLRVGVGLEEGPVWVGYLTDVQIGKIVPLAGLTRWQYVRLAIRSIQIPLPVCLD